MIPKIEKILYATDLSEKSDYAFRYAIMAAHNHDAQIYVLHVLERNPPAESYPLRDSPLGENLKKLYEKESVAAAEKIRKRLEEISQRERQNMPEGLNRVQILIVDGQPAAASDIRVACCAVFFTEPHLDPVCPSGEQGQVHFIEGDIDAVDRVVRIERFC